MKRKNSLLSLLTAILMTMVLVIMSNSPPVKTNLSFNAGTKFSFAQAETTAVVVMPSQTTSDQFTVLEVADVKRSVCGSVTLTAYNQISTSINAANSNSNYKMITTRRNSSTALMRDDRSHILKHPLTTAFSADPIST